MKMNPVIVRLPTFYSPYFFASVTSTRLLLSIVTIFFSGCLSPHAHTSIQPEVLYDPQVAATFYLEQIDQQPYDQRSRWQLLAVRKLLQEKATTEAETLLRSITITTQPQNTADRCAVLQREKILLQAEIAGSKKENHVALKCLQDLHPTILTPIQQQRYYRLQYNAAIAEQNFLVALRALVALYPLLPRIEQQNNIDQTWYLLLHLAQQQSTPSITPQPYEITLQGWLSLLEKYQHNLTTQQLKTVITQWQQQHRTHPAARQLPTLLSHKMQTKPFILHKVGLLLPLSGANRQLGETIQQGFIDGMNYTGHYNQSFTAKLMFSPSTLAKEQILSPEIIPYDTAAQPLAKLIQQTKQDGISLLIGPLLKKDLMQLHSIKTQYPIVALNTPEQPCKNRQIYYFSLSLKDEAKLATLHIWNQKQRYPLVLAPDTRLGHKIATFFEQQWKKNGGVSIAIAYFKPIKALQKAINIEDHMESKEQANMQIAQALGLTRLEESALLLPHNIDAIYCIATPDEMLLLKSMLDLITPNSGKKPTLYASSRTFRSAAGLDFRLEMEGLQLSDAPLLITNYNEAIQQRAALLLKQNDALLRLYAMGMDSWQLALHYNEIRQLPNFRIPGATGLLSIDDHYISRQLPWVQFQQGQLILVQP